MEVEFFDSMEQAMARLEEARKAADARVKPWQASLKPGDCFLSIVEDGLVVFGEVLEGYRDERLQHYRFCRCYSVACPEGELGDVHVSTIACRISRGFFEQMQKAGWAMEGPAASPATSDEMVGRPTEIAWDRPPRQGGRPSASFFGNGRAASLDVGWTWVACVC